MKDTKLIRNFAIVAHIDHGKSTLADRLLEMTKTVDPREMKEQILDSNPIERERGITIKLAPVCMKYIYRNQRFTLNLIDTPGHVDFSYEVSRSLSACEGILLVVDATSGIQAQTLAHMQLVRQNKLKVIPIINKIDLPTARIEEVTKDLEEIFQFQKDEIIQISAKNGTNINQVLEAVITRLPPPRGDGNYFRALVFSSLYDNHRGVIIYVRIVDGEIEKRNPNTLKFYASNAIFNPVDFGIFTPDMKSCNKLSRGEVGYIATGLKDIKLARIGDTIGLDISNIMPLPGYIEPKPMVYLAFYPTDNEDYLQLRESINKLHLTDSSFTYQTRSSLALGKGFLCGFLGLLHAEIVKERLEREFEVNIIATAPTVEYKIKMTDDSERIVQTPEDFPDPSQISQIYEPYMITTIYSPKEYVGNIIKICEKKRSEFINLEYFGLQAKFTYLMPLADMFLDFFDKLKSVTAGYASLDFEFYEMRDTDVVKLSILINREVVDAFSQIVAKPFVQSVANDLVARLKHLIPKQQIQIPIQATIGGKIIARSDVKSFRKDVTAKLYGGDRTRKDKLLEKQKKGKKRMRRFGMVEIPQEVFLEVYKAI